MNRNEELPCKGLTVTFIDRILDVTPYVNEQLKTDEDPDGTNYLSPKYLEKVTNVLPKQKTLKPNPGNQIRVKGFLWRQSHIIFS